MENKRTDPDYWKKRAEEGSKVFEEQKKVGRPMNMESPAQLWGYACEYFERCDSMPWLRTDYKGKEVEEVQIPTSAPYLWSGFEDFLFEKGICRSLKDYRTAANKNPEELDEKYKRFAEFSEVIRAIDNIMTSQKISGGLVNAYNSNLVARLEGLVDKKEDVGRGKGNKRPTFVFVNKSATESDELK